MKTRNVLAMISPMSSERVSGIARYAKEHGWNLMLQDRLGHTPLAWHGDGVLATLRDDPTTLLQIKKLMSRGIPLVDLTVSCPEINVPRVVSDHAEIGRLAAAHFAEREFHHVAWFSFGWSNVHRLRAEGFATAWGKDISRWVIQSSGGEGASAPERRRPRLLSGKSHPPHSFDWKDFVAWIGARLAEVPKPLAVLTYDESDAARLLYAARELGVNVPEELAILSIGNNPLICENQSVPLSSIDQNLERGGYEAAALLDRLMDGHTETDTILVPPGGVVTRRSTDVVAVTDPTIRRALLFISTRLADPIGAPQIAHELGCRRAELDKLFRTQLNRSVGAEIRRQRLARVKLLLQTTTQTISEIARTTGFCTPSHLTNAFRATVGLTPKDWRAMREWTREDPRP